MLRIVAYRKGDPRRGRGGARLGSCGAASRHLLGIPVFDSSGTRDCWRSPTGRPAAVVARRDRGTCLAVGVAWAAFYAYFVWARFRPGRRRCRAGFRGDPCVLATLLVIPQLPAHASATRIGRADSTGTRSLAGSATATIYTACHWGMPCSA